MKILCITHADFEGPGVIEKWAADRGHSFKIEKPYKGENLSDPAQFDFIIVMGGPQSPLSIDQAPYLQDEINLLRSSLSLGKKIIGFCLGAQLIGEALGAKTARSPHKEIGVFPIKLTNDANSDKLLSGLENEFPAIHWHNDMPGETKNSVVLASSAGCPRQIIKYNENAYGFQCHLEIDLEGIKTLIDAVPNDLAPSLYTQSVQELVANDYASINQLMFTILDQFVA